MEKDFFDEASKCDDYTISKELGITQRVVNNLKIKKELKYPKNDADSWKEELPSIISNASYENGRIKLYIENPVVRMELEHILVNQGNFADYSFNPHILSLTPLCFLSILPLISDSDGEKIKEYIIKKISGNAREEKELSEKIESDSFSKTVKEKGIELTFDIISNIISDAIPAGDLLKEPIKHLENCCDHRICNHFPCLSFLHTGRRCLELHKHDTKRSYQCNCYKN